MSHSVAFPGLSEEQAKTVYNQIAKLRSIGIDRAGSSLRKFVGDEQTVRVALVLIADDPTQMRLVAHIPTIVLEDLRCAKLVSARMSDQVREVSRASTVSHVSKEEFDKLVAVVIEFSSQLAETQTSTVGEIGGMLGDQVKTHHDVQVMIHGQQEIFKSVEMRMSSFEAVIKNVAVSIGGIQNAINRLCKYVQSWSITTGYIDKDAELERGIGQSLFRRY